MTPNDRRNTVRFFAIAALAFSAIALLTTLHRFFADKFHHVTGKARWIWMDRPFVGGEPVAFFVTREFDLPADRRFVRLKVAGDPEYTLYFNGVEVGANRFREKRLLDIYDVSGLARERKNRVVAALRSAKGVGGFLLSVDTDVFLQNIVYTDSRWKVVPEWAETLLSRDPPRVLPVRLLGRPPAGRWNYLEPVKKELPAGERRIVLPSRALRFDARLPLIRVLSGIAVASSRPTVATAFDFGPVVARGRVGAPPSSRQRVIRVRYASDLRELHRDGEIESLVLAKGESEVIDPERREFRYIVVYGVEARVSAVVE